MVNTVEDTGMSWDDMTPRTYSHVILAGEPKTGKSLLVAQLAEAGFKLLWISTDNGHLVISQIAPEFRGNFRFIILPDTKENPVAAKTIPKLFTGARVKVCWLHGEISCVLCAKAQEKFTEVCLNDLDSSWVVVLDHASQLARSVDNLLIVRGAPKREDQDFYKQDWDDYRAKGYILDRVFSNIQHGRYHCAVLAHIIEVKFEDGSKKLIPLIGTENYSRQVGGFFDHMVFCEVLNGKHNFGSSTGFKMNAVTGSRTNIHIEDQKIPSLAPFFTGEIQPSKEPIALKILEQIQPQTPVVTASADASKALEALKSLKGIK